MHALQQLPLLAAARVIDEVPGENLFKLSDGEVLYRLFIVEIGQRGPDPPLRRWADLHRSTAVIPHSAEPSVSSVDVNRNKQHTSKMLSAGSRFNRDAVGVSSCSCVAENQTLNPFYLLNLQSKCWCFYKFVCDVDSSWKTHEAQRELLLKNKISEYKEHYTVPWSASCSFKNLSFRYV